MPTPLHGPGGTHAVDQILTNMSVAYRNARDSYVATRVFPICPVARESDKYRTYDKGDWFRDEAEVRADGTPAASGAHEYSSATYSCLAYAFKEAITARQLVNADADLQLEFDTTEFVTEKLLIKLERLWAAAFFKTGVWTDKTGVAAGPAANQFVRFSVAGSDPVGVIDQYKQDVKLLTGQSPNKLIAGANAARVLRNHADIKDRVKYVQMATLGQLKAKLAELFEVEEFLVANASVNTAKKGVADVMAYAMNANDILLVYAAPRPSLKLPSGGYVFASTSLPYSDPTTGLRIKRWKDENIDGEWFEGQALWDPKVVAADMGIYLSSAVS